MRKTVLEHFILVLLAVLYTNSVIFYIASSNVILTTSSRDMGYTIKAVDSILDYDRDLMSQMHKLEAFIDQDLSRITLIRADGTVITDSDADAEYLDNHLGREEIRVTTGEGEGHTRRYSSTLGKTMLCVTCRSDHADIVLRLAVPYSGISEYLPMLLPTVIVNFGAVMLCSLITTQRFVFSVTKPMRDISRRMLQVKKNYTELHFDRYQYPEINVIIETITNMFQNVKEYLNQIDREKQIRQEFFSNAPHELKTPIVSIQGYAELLESGMIQDEPIEVDFARGIKREAANMASLISGIPMVSRLKTKDAEVVTTDMRISVLLGEIMDNLKPQATSGQVLMRVDCWPLCIKANIQQIKEPLINLLSNAVKYNHPGGQVWVNIQEQDDNMIIRIRDNGMGIPEKSLDCIFEWFYCVDKEHNRKQGGMGLGFSIVKRIMSFYHGTIHVTSRLEQNTEFAVSLPLNRYEKWIIRRKIHSITLDSQKFRVIKLTTEFLYSMIENTPKREQSMG